MEMLFLLKNLYRDPLALSRFSQFRCLHISKGEIIQNLNETHEFQVCFVLKGSLCLFRDHIESMPLMAMLADTLLFCYVDKEPQYYMHE